jgi:hypothetical protein
MGHLNGWFKGTVYLNDVTFGKVVGKSALVGALWFKSLK